METQIPEVYKAIRVESMYWDDMRERFPRDEFREEDVEFEKNAENVDSIYIVITNAKRSWRERSPKKMVYWRWGPEGKFYHHLRALYQAIEGGDEMPQPYQKQLKKLWEKCKKGRTFFQDGTKFKGIGTKRYPNDEREDRKRLEERFEKIKSQLTVGGGDLEVFVRRQTFENILSDGNIRNDIRNEIKSDIQRILQNGDRNNAEEKVQQRMISKQSNPRDKLYIELYLLIDDIERYVLRHLLPIDYVIAFILKSYEKRDIIRNEKNSFKIFGLKSNNTIWLNDQIYIYAWMNRKFWDFANIVSTYLNGGFIGVTDNDDEININPLYKLIQNDHQEESIRNYFVNNFQDQIRELNQMIPAPGGAGAGAGAVDAPNNIKIFFQGKYIIDFIVALPKRERKLVASILQKKKDNIIQAIPYYFQGEKLYISFSNLYVFIFLWTHSKNKNVLKQFLNNPYYVNLLQPRIEASIRPGAGVSTGRTNSIKEHTALALEPASSVPQLSELNIQKRILKNLSSQAAAAAAAQSRPSRISSGQSSSQATSSQATTPSSVQTTGHESSRIRQSSRQSSGNPSSPGALDALKRIPKGTVNKTLQSYARSLTHI
jgi:hypothetical protein